VYVQFNNVHVTRKVCTNFNIEATVMYTRKYVYCGSVTKHETIYMYKEKSVYMVLTPLL